MSLRKSARQSEQHSSLGMPIKYCKFQQIELFARTMGVEAEELPILHWDNKNSQYGSFEIILVTLIYPIYKDVVDEVVRWDVALKGSALSREARSQRWRQCPHQRKLSGHQ